MPSPAPIKTYHPNSTLPPTRSALETALRGGWLAQAKIDGWRAQLHRTKSGIVAFTRTGNPLPLPLSVSRELAARLVEGDVVEGEWVSERKEVHVFDVIAWRGEVLRKKTFAERFALLDPVQGERVRVLPLLREIEAVMAVMELEDETIEGVVLRRPDRAGFGDADIMRCRRLGHRHCSFQPMRARPRRPVSQAGTKS